MKHDCLDIRLQTPLRHEQAQAAVVLEAPNVVFSGAMKFYALRINTVIPMTQQAILLDMWRYMARMLFRNLVVLHMCLDFSFSGIKSVCRTCQDRGLNTERH